MNHGNLTMCIEAGGWGDPQLPLISPNGTAGEWFQDPYDKVGYTFSGPGKSLSSPADIEWQTLIL